MKLPLNIRTIVVILIAVLLIAFVLTGNLAKQPDSQSFLEAQAATNSLNASDLEINDAEKSGKKALIRSVRTEDIISEPIEKTLTLRGKTQASAFLNLRAETDGRIIERHVESGDTLKEGDLMFSFDPRDIHARIEHGKALVVQKQLTYERAQKLRSDNLLAKANLAEAYVDLKSAESNLASLKVAKKGLEIRAPFDGTLDLRYVEEGQWVTAGENMGKFASYDPLLIKIDASAKEAHQIKASQLAEVELITGETFPANVFFISLLANRNTNTFEIVLNAIPKFEPTIGEGITATVTIPIGEVQAHSVSPALFELDQRGQLSLKHLDAHNVVHRSSIEVIKAGSSSVWVTGLPQQARLITQGHGFVDEGDQVVIEQ